MRVAVKLLLIFVLVFAGVKIWYGRLEDRLRVPVAAKESTVTEPEVERTEIARKPDDYTIIVDRNIFQAAITKVEKVEAPPLELTATKLKLSLMGTISGVERDSRAIISDDQKKQQDIYQIGDSIQGALIKTIERGRVVLNVNGADEELLLKDREGGGPAYEPSPADFFQEPEAPAEPVAEPVAEPAVEPAAEAEAVETAEQPTVPEVPGQPLQPEMAEPQPEPETPAVIEPTARPRPQRRVLRMPASKDGNPYNASGMRKGGKENIKDRED
jgi:type II secretory pathway component PulC